MQILYVSLSYLPSRRASSVHVMRMCAALARAGHGVTLVGKASDEPAAAGQDIHAFYGVEPTFEIVDLPRPKRRGGGAVFAALMAATLVAQRKRIDLVYGRDVLGAAAAAALRMPVVWESHGIPAPGPIRSLTKRVARSGSLRGLVAISEALRADLGETGLLPTSAPVIVAHDAADDPGPLVPRVRGDRPRVGYVGGLYPGRGIEIVVALASRLPHVDVEIIGGNEKDLAAWRAKPTPPNLRFVGFVPPAQLADRYRTFDVLLMPYARSGVKTATGASDTSRWASPMKMFEYMASGVPIVSSDLPVLGEVLADNVNALIAPWDDPSAWQRAVERLLLDEALADRIAKRAYADLVAHHTWDARVDHILRSIS